MRRRATIATTTIIAKPISSPGTTPPRNSAPTETPVIEPNSTSGIDGGITGPTVAEAAEHAAENVGSYPRSVIAFTSIEPSPIASASADPDMPANTIEPTMFTCPSPPFMCPTSMWANRKIRSVIPPVFIRLPARMKNGMASSGNAVVLA